MTGGRGASIVLSEFARKWPDLESVLGRATNDDVAIGEGHGRDILGHPFNSVAWLATQLASRGLGLKAGQVVMTGSVMKTVFPMENATYRFDLEKIGFVEVRVTEKKRSTIMSSIIEFGSDCSFLKADFDHSAVRR